MLLRRLILPATLVLMPWLTADGWGQSYSTQRNGFAGSVRTVNPHFNLPDQATAPPLFADQQGNDYTAMSPDSWGHPATVGRQSQPVHAAPHYPNTSQFIVQEPTPANQPLVLNPSNTSRALEQQSEFTPLTNTGNRSRENTLSDTNDSGPLLSEPKSVIDQQPKPSGDRYASLQDFKSEVVDLYSKEAPDKVPFPFTRRSQSQPVNPVETPGSGSVNNLIDSATNSTAPSLQTPVDSGNRFSAPSTSAGSSLFPTFQGTVEDSGYSTSDSELGLYPRPRNASPVVQSPVIAGTVSDHSIFEQPALPAQTSGLPNVPQQSFQQQIQLPNQGQTPAGFNYPAAGTAPSQNWQPSDQPTYFDQDATVHQQGAAQQVPGWASMIQTNHPGSPTQPTLPNFRPDLGHRDALPTVRNQQIPDDGKKFDHENKKIDYPPIKEIIATGKFFYNAEVNIVRPSFLGNTGLSVDNPGFSESQPFEFSTTYAPQFKFGFESQYGPGVELSYFNLTANADPLGGTSDGTGSVSSIAAVTGPGRFSTISADVAGETLIANHSFELETIGLNFFKELKFPISRLNGKFGFIYANVAQSLLVDVTDASGAVVGELNNTSDFRGYGPQFALEYFRPVGHTPLTLVTSFGGKGLFGRRDQFLNNDTESVERRFGADEFITVIDFAGGVQLKKLVADGRYWTAKVGYVHQSWLGGGTAVDPQGDFGLNGFVFSVGYNR